MNIAHFTDKLQQQRKMLIKLEREKQRRKEEILKNQQEFNLLKNEEQKIKVKTMYGQSVEYINCKIILHIR